MSISTMDSITPIFLSKPPRGILRLDDNHALAIMRWQADVLDITGGFINEGGYADYASEQILGVKAMLVDPDNYKVTILHDLSAGRLGAVNLIVDPDTNTFTAGNDVIVRDSYNDNPDPGFGMNFLGGACYNGNGTVDAWWNEFTGGVVGLDTTQG